MPVYPPIITLVEHFALSTNTILNIELYTEVYRPIAVSNHKIELVK